MSVYYIPGWLLAFSSVLALLAFWYHAITLTSATLAMNRPRKGYCSFLIEGWALMASVQIASFALAYSLGISISSDIMLLSLFIGSALLSLPLFLFAYQCLTS